MAGVFWDSEGVIYVDFLPHGVTFNAQYYSKLLHNDVHQTIQKKRPGKLSKKIILLHDNACPRTADLMKVTLATVDWEMMNHPPYSPDLASSDFNLFGPIEVHLGGQKFQTDDKLKHSVLH
jgi:histone-lysine N-methyltransferase SETMAR